MPSRSADSSRSSTSPTTLATKVRRSSVKSTRSEASYTTSSPSHEAIAIRAHELYVQSGFEGGRELEFWLEAERELKGGLKLH